MAVSSDLLRDTLVVLRLKLSRNKFVSGYPVTGRQLAVCSAFTGDKTQYLQEKIANNPGSRLIFRMSFH